MLPEFASWLGEFKSELLGFPSARHKDQMDSLSQLMNWVLRRQIFGMPVENAGPMIFDGTTGLWTGEGAESSAQEDWEYDDTYDPWLPED